MTRFWSSRRGAAPLLLLLSLAGGIVGCGDSTGPEEGPPAGLVVTQAGLTLVRVEGAVVKGSLSVQAGETSPLLEVTFTDEDGFALSTSNRYMTVEVADEGLATFLQSADGAFTGRISGGQDGGFTTIRFILNSGSPGSGSVEYTSPPIQLRVVGLI